MPEPFPSAARPARTTPFLPIEGLRVVITGAGSGIGEALALALASRGARLLLTDIDPDRVQRVAEALRRRGADADGLALDVASAAHWQQLAEHALQRWPGGADVLVNNAGIALVAPIESAPEAQARQLMEVNFWGPALGCRAFLPQLRRRPRAMLVNVSSIFAMISMPTQGWYNASKAALRALSDALRLELEGTPVRVLCVHPGGVRTRIAQDARIVDMLDLAGSAEALAKTFERNAPTSPEQAAAVLLQAIETGRERLLIGWDAKLGDALWRLAPQRAARWLLAQVRRRAVG